MNFSGGGAVKAPDNIHQRGFSASAVSDNRKHFALLDGKVESLQRHYLNISNFIQFYKILTKNHRFI